MAVSSLLSTSGLAIGYRTKGRPRRALARGLDLELRAGLVALLGPNGAGKSTLLRTLSGLQRPLEGRIRLLDRPMEELSARQIARRVAVLFSGRPWAARLTAGELVALGRQPHTGWWGRLGPRDREQVRRALATVGADALAARPVAELSDGECQKVTIARALAQEARVMLLDEPTAFLDLPRRVDLLHRLRDLTRTSGQSIVFSSHDLDLALQHADRLWLLSSDGVLRQGAPEDLILDGSLEEAFHRDGIAFDASSASFRLGAAAGVPVEVVGGDGLATQWTRRALRRIGLVEGSAPSSLRVEVDEASGTRWVLTSRARGRSEHSSLESLLRQLEAETSVGSRVDPRGSSREIDTA